MTDKMREEFEAWAITSAWLGIGDESQMHQDAEGTGYNEIEVHTAWLAWQASRDSLVIELPVATVSMFATSRDARAAQEGLDMARGAITDAGLKVKP